MRTSPRMQAFIVLLCERQGIDWSLAVAGDYLRVENPDGNATLLIAHLDDEYTAVRYTLWHEQRMVIQLEMKFLVTPNGWEPVNVQDCFSRSWEEYWTEAGREGITVFDETGMLILPSITEYWADRLVMWGWLRKGLLEDGALGVLASHAQPFPEPTKKASQTALAADPSSAPITETLTQASLF